jgi:hypothetical protein
MSRPRTSLPAIAIAMSCIALVAALAGSAYAAGLITGRDVKNDSLTGRDVKNGSLKGAELLTRVASAATPGEALIGASGRHQLLMTNIVAPVPGFLVITGSSDIYNYTDNDNISCWIRVDARVSESSERTIQLNYANSVNQEENCATDVAVPVRKGPHAVRLMSYNESTNTIFDETTLEAVFVPFGPSGKAPTSFQVPKSASAGHANR